MDRLYAFYLSIFPLRIIKYHNFRVDKFCRAVAKKYDKSGKKILDIGAENSPYSQYFKYAEYFTQDIQQNKSRSINYVGDLTVGLSQVLAESFDYVLCTQVLEHINKPQCAFAEFNRILKKDGRLFLTTHMCYDEHMIPNDYFRFTKYGLKFLGISHGFILEHIEPHGGVFHVLSRIIDVLPVKLFIKKQHGFLYYSYLLIFTVPIFLFNSFCYFLDFLDREKTLTLNYECIYKKI